MLLTNNLFEKNSARLTKIWLNCEKYIVESIKYH